MYSKTDRVKKFVKVLAAAVLVLCLCLAVCACGRDAAPDSGGDLGGTENPGTPETPDRPDEEWSRVYALPEADSVNARLIEIYGSHEKTYLLGNAIQRMPCPENGAYMTFNMRYEVGLYARMILEDAVNEFNEVFAVINPNYRFRINYSPNQSDFSDKYSIRMNITDNFSSPDVMGTAQVSTGEYLGNFGITLKDTTLDDIRYLMLTFRHEFMHLLGAGDAYANPVADKTTVMQNYNNTVYRSFSQSDVAFIDAYYRNPANSRSDEEIRAYINGYENENTHSQEKLLSKILKTALQNSDSATLTAQLDGLHYENSTGLKAVIQDGLTFDPSFGSDKISFTELSYADGYKPKDTFYGCFDPGTGQYEHGTNRGNMSFSNWSGYADLGGGILLAMPGGTDNMTLFARAENYALAFHANGLHLGNDYKYFLTLSEIELPLLRVYSC